MLPLRPKPAKLPLPPYEGTWLGMLPGAGMSESATSSCHCGRLPSCTHSSRPKRPCCGLHEQQRGRVRGVE